MGSNGMDWGPRQLSRMGHELAYRLVLDESGFDDHCALPEGVSSYRQQPCQGGGASIFGFEWRATAIAKISYYQWRTGRVWPLHDCR